MKISQLVQKYLEGGENARTHACMHRLISRYLDTLIVD